MFAKDSVPTENVSPPVSSEHNEELDQFTISVAAELAGMHAQTLRAYDRLGLVSPVRTKGGGRRYTLRDVRDLREVQRLSQDDGINLAGIKRILEQKHRIELLETKVDELQREKHALLRQTTIVARGRSVALVRRPTGTAMELWKPRRRGSSNPQA